MERLRFYGSGTNCRRALRRYIARGEDLADQAAGVRKRIDALPGDRNGAILLENQWGKEFRKWFAETAKAMSGCLQDQFASALPTLAYGLPPEDGKPRHTVALSNGESWLQQAIAELRELREAVGAAPATAQTSASRNGASLSPRGRLPSVEPGLYLAVVGILLFFFGLYFNFARSLRLRPRGLAIMPQELTAFTTYRGRIRRAVALDVGTPRHFGWPICSRSRRLPRVAQDLRRDGRGALGNLERLRERGWHAGPVHPCLHDVADRLSGPRAASQRRACVVVPNRGAPVVQGLLRFGRRLLQQRHFIGKSPEDAVHRSCWPPVHDSVSRTRKASRPVGSPPLLVSPSNTGAAPSRPAHPTPTPRMKTGPACGRGAPDWKPKTVATKGSSNGNHDLPFAKEHCSRPPTGYAARSRSAEYKHLVLGLLFLRYISDSFERRRAWLEAATRNPDNGDYFTEHDAARQAILEDRDEYISENIFWVPEAARFPALLAAASLPDIGERIDRALDAIRVRQSRAAAGSAAAHLRARADPAGEARRACRDGRKDRVRGRPGAGPRRARAHVRVLHQVLREGGRPSRRRVLHPCLSNSVASRNAGTVRGARARPCMRVGRPVCPVGRVRQGARR